MKIRFATQKLEKIFNNATLIKRNFGTIARRLAKRLEDIRSSPNLSILILLPGADCHALIGNRKGQWAIQISGNARLIFRINQSPIPILENGDLDTKNITEISIVEITDYH